jgi:hypothetical protein
MHLYFPISHLARCNICNKLVSLEFARRDDDGKTVHEGCYLLKVRRKPPSSSLPPPSDNNVR